MNSPCVSVVMSVFNNAETVGLAMDSILAQSFDDFELIVIDDGSTDGSAKVVADRVRRDPRVSVISQENTGLTRALIRGCAEARGRFIARQDADDWSHADRLSEQVAVLDTAPEVGFVSCWSECCGPRGELLDVVVWPADSAQAGRLLLCEMQGPIHGSVMFRSELYQTVDGYREQFYFAQDVDLWLRMVERAQIAYIQRALYRFVHSSTSITGLHRSHQQQFCDLGCACRQARIEDRAETPFLEEAQRLTDRVRQGRANASERAANVITSQYFIGCQLLRRGDPRAAGYFWSCICRRPWHLKAWIQLLRSAVVRGSSQDATRN